MFEEIATSKQHVSLYRGPSVFIHGDPIGMRKAFPMDAGGRWKEVIRLSDAELNVRLIDASSVIVELLCAFRDAFPKFQNGAEVDFLISELLRENMVHSLRFPQHRASDYLAKASVELGLPKMSRSKPNSTFSNTPGNSSIGLVYCAGGAGEN